MLDVGGVLAAGGARVVRGHGAPLADLKHCHTARSVQREPPQTSA